MMISCIIASATTQSALLTNTLPRDVLLAVIKQNVSHFTRLTSHIYLPVKRSDMPYFPFFFLFNRGTGIMRDINYKMPVCTIGYDLQHIH